jgi:hypothetical protein
VNVVAAPVAVVHAQDRLEVAEQVGLRQVAADDLADHRRAPEAAADQNLEAEPAVGAVHDVHADIMDLGSGAVGRCAGHRDLELARQVAEFRMQRRPLADDLAPGPGVRDLVRRDARQMVGGDIADAVAAGLDRVHLHRGEVGEDVRHVLELRPVELDVLPRREVTIIPVVLARDMRQHAHLARRQQPVGNGDAQHVRMALHIQAVPQPQGAEVVLAQFAGQEAPCLVTELPHPLVDERLVDVIVLVHALTVRDPRSRYHGPGRHST